MSLWYPLQRRTGGRHKFAYAGTVRKTREDLVMVIITMKMCIESKVHLWNGSIGNSVIPRLTQRFHNCESRTKQYLNIQSRQLSRRAPKARTNRVRASRTSFSTAPLNSHVFLVTTSVITLVSLSSYASTLGRSSAGR